MKPSRPQHIFAEVCLSPKALRLWDALAHGPLKFTDIHTFFQRNLRPGELDLLLKELADRIEVLPGNSGNAKEMVVKRR